MAYRVRFYMDMNAREAMHVIELRTSPQGHPSYRRIREISWMHQSRDRRRRGPSRHRRRDAVADHSWTGASNGLQSERNMETKRSATCKPSPIGDGSARAQ